MVYMILESDADREAYRNLWEQSLSGSVREGRAFCPGASPPDNSCSPANKDGSPAKPKGDPSSKPFKEWFAGSVAVNDDGSPLLIWRGGQARETFDPAAATKKGGEYGIFVTARKGYAETYARPDAWRGAKAHPYYISIRNPLFVENKGEISPGQLTKADIDRLKSQGYDSIAVVKYKDPINKVGPDPISKASEIVLFEDSQIVSAAPKKGSRAFCPGASPPDNSCSPANKDGSGARVRVSDASEGSPFEKELHYKTEGGIIKVAKSKWSPADWSITETFVDEDKRRKGIASALLEQVKKDLPGSISAQASSDKSVALFWKHGFRLPDDGTIDDARKRRKEDSSVLLIYDPAGRGKRASRRAFCPGASPPDNSCSPANKGEGGHVRIARERPQSTTYSPSSLADGPAPALYEGGELKDGQTVWDRYSVASSTSIGNSDRKDSADGSVDYEVKADASSDKLFSDPYGEESKAERQSLNQRMPLRVQYDELAKIGAAALGVTDSGSQTSVANPDKDGNRDAWVAQQYTSSVTVDAMQLMSHIARTPEQQAEMERELATLSRTTSERVPTQQDVDRLSELARTTELPEGVTLFHGMPGVNERKALEELAASGGTMRLNKLTSATTRPAVATQFSDTTSKKDVGPTSPESWASNGAYIHEDGTIGSVVRILKPRRGLPMGSVSMYRNEAEVLLAPASKLRFTGARRRVYIPAANDSGWPSDTFSTKGAKQAGPRSRTLVPVIVYDAVME